MPDLEPLEPPPLVTVASADRQLARSAVAVFVLAGLVSLLGPYLSYRSDEAQLHALFEARVARDAAVFADALGRQVLLLHNALGALATRISFDANGDLAKAQRELLVANQSSGFFGGTLLLVDPAGRVHWSSDADVDANALVGRPWLKRLLATRLPTVDVLPGGRETFLLGVPVLHEGKLAGALIGRFGNAESSALPLPPLGAPFERVVFDEDGEVLLPDKAPAWTKTPGLVPELDAQDGQVRPLPVAGSDASAAEVDVGATGLHLALVGHEKLSNGPTHRRFLLQMLLLMSLQAGAVLILSVVVRRFYRRFLANERRAVEHDRLLALGGAASLIAHEVKNSLNGLKAAASLLSTGEDPQLPVKSIRGEVDRLQHLAQSLLLFGKPAAVQTREVGLSELVGEVVDGLRVMPETEEVQLTTELTDSLVVQADPLLLATAVHNLVRNAIEAAVSAKDLGRVQQPRVLVSATQESDAVVIAVEDNAGGPSEEVVQRLFEPFVSGKPKGIGLGLSMSRRAVEGQGGAVLFERTVEGSRFSIRLPLEKGATT